MDTSITLPPLWNVREAADALKLSTVTIYRLSPLGRLPTVRVGGRVLFSPDDIQEYIRLHRTTANPGRNGDSSPHRSTTINLKSLNKEKGNEI